ncbi:CAP domain-containing protein [Tabrizicola caldifontis]|uniref:CAP domain-containing protein n=1 Tax=Tabrizicola caldifontis TaxID=2528036 RepID=UPI00108063D3|nr:CAP domain-containing protein [Rhodobacter sp. YIM 73028]
MITRHTLAATAAALLIGLGLPVHACIMPPNAKALQQEVLANLNAQRKAHGLTPFKIAPKLEKAAQAHACDNALRRSISHDSSDGGTLKTRLKRAGYNFRAAAENTGRGFGTGARAVDWWMNSPKHRQNILFPRVKDVGIGIALSEAPDNKLHWVINFGASK